jgi:hypothetical protein
LRRLPLAYWALAGGVAATTLGGCGQAQAGLRPPIGGAVTMEQSIASAAKAQDLRSALLYVTTEPETVYVYRYRKPKELATLGMAGPAGICSNGSGHVFILSDDGVYEYKHDGASPIDILSAPGGTSCSVDPTTGDLAIISAYAVYIFRHTKGGWLLPRARPLGPRLYFGGYDPSGNLFVDGLTGSGALIFAELPKGGTTFTSNGTANTSRSATRRRA